MANGWTNVSVREDVAKALFTLRDDTELPMSVLLRKLAVLGRDRIEELLLVGVPKRARRGRDNRSRSIRAESGDKVAI